MFAYNWWYGADPQPRTSPSSYSREFLVRTKELLTNILTLRSILNAAKPKHFIEAGWEVVQTIDPSADGGGETHATTANLTQSGRIDEKTIIVEDYHGSATSRPESRASPPQHARFVCVLSLFRTSVRRGHFHRLTLVFRIIDLELCVNLASVPRIASAQAHFALV